ncbi:MAG TPA: phosphohistidine phosphatase SixA [Thermodesulfobacteriota bacterium]|nr:phosphohistidine phosphatase SixA [Thermodesulfobacteriota bacterium]
MKLYFLRHGLAGDRTRWPGDDFDRPLTDEGKDRIAREAVTIAHLELGLEVVMTSPLVRAFQTAEIVARKLNLLDKLVKDERLGPGFSAPHVPKILAAHAKANAVMLVGHEPSFSEAISYLIGGGRVVCKKGSLACVDLEDASSLRGKLLWLLQPKVLAR